MPLYKYECKNCNTEAEEFRTVAKRHDIQCSNCESSMTIVLCPHQVLTKHKWKQSGKNRLDAGIPFGSVPGDEDYHDLSNPLGPKP